MILKGGIRFVCLLKENKEELRKIVLNGKNSVENEDIGRGI